jgi:hypothetical protein
MRTNHLFAASAIAVMLVATVPAQAQRLGGAGYGALSARQGVVSANGFSRVRAGASGEASVSAAGGAGVSTQRTPRVDTAAKVVEHDTVRSAEAVKGGTEATGRGAVQTAASSTARAATGVNGTTAATENAVGRANLTAAGQGGVQAGKLSTANESAGGFSGGRETQNAPAGTSSGGKPASTQTSSGNGAAPAEVNASAAVQGSVSH